MREMMKKPAVVISMCAVIVAALVFGTVMVAKNAMADPSTYIGVSKAKEIALQDAGMTEKDVTFTKAKLDNDKDVYDVEFYSDKKDCEYEINSTSGVIVDKELKAIKSTNGNKDSNKDNDDDDNDDYDDATDNDNDADDNNDAVSGATENTGDQNNGSQNSGSNNSATSYIGTASAKNIALSNAGLSASQVSFTKVALDHDDGVSVYEVEFHKGNTEYEYEINAITGTILDKSIDVDDDIDD